MISMTTLEKRFPVACLALHLLSRGPVVLFGGGGSFGFWLGFSGKVFWND